MASRKEERERMRAERESRMADAAKQERKRLILGYAAAGLITLAVVAGIVAVIAGGDDNGGGGEGVSEDDALAAGLDLNSGLIHGVEPDTRESGEIEAGRLINLERVAKASGCELREGLEEEGSTHVGEAKEPDYETAPASSGNHSPEPQADGAYLEPVSPLYYVHSLEHGRIAIAYSPELPEQDQLELKGLFAEDPEGMLLFPEPDMPYEIAAVAWTNLIGCDSYEGSETLDILRTFRDRWRGRGPEAVPL